MLEAHFFFPALFDVGGCRDALSNPAFFAMSSWGTEVWSPSCSGASCWMPGCAWCRCTAGLHPEWFGTWPYISKINIAPALAFFQVLGMQSVYTTYLWDFFCIWHFESMYDLTVWCLAGGQRAVPNTWRLSMELDHATSPCNYLGFGMFVYSLDFWVLTVQLFLCHSKIIIWAKRLASAPMVWRLSSPGVVQSFGYLLRQKWRVDYTSPTWCQHFQSNGYRWYWMNMYENGWKCQFTEQCHLLQNPPLQ